MNDVLNDCDLFEINLYGINFEPYQHRRMLIMLAMPGMEIMFQFKALGGLNKPNSIPVLSVYSGHVLR